MLHSKSCVVDATCAALRIDPQSLVEDIGHDGRENGFDPIELSLPLAARGWAMVVLNKDFTNLKTHAVKPYISIKETVSGVGHAIPNQLPEKSTWLILFRRLQSAVPFREETAVCDSKQTAAQNRSKGVRQNNAACTVHSGTVQKKNES